MSALGATTASGAGDDNEVMADIKAARSVCRHDGRAQEAVQETFISIWMTRGTH